MAGGCSTDGDMVATEQLREETSRPAINKSDLLRDEFGVPDVLANNWVPLENAAPVLATESIPTISSTEPTSAPGRPTAAPAPSMQQASAPPPPYYGGASDDYQEPLTGSAFDFNEQTVRKGFIRKVYSILMVQLAVTAGIIAIFFAESVREYATKNQWIFWVAFAGTLACLFTLACCENMRRKTPHNFIFLGIFTVCEGVLLGCACASFKASEVLMAVGICTVVCLALTMFAFQTKYDFTMLNGILFVCLIILMIFGIFAMIFPGKVISLVYASLGALLFSVYLVVDTQMMMGGKHKYSISPEEYIFAALNLYLDIINLFLYILQIVAAANRN